MQPYQPFLFVTCLNDKLDITCTCYYSNSSCGVYLRLYGISYGHVTHTVCMRLFTKTLSAFHRFITWETRWQDSFCKLPTSYPGGFLQSQLGSVSRWRLKNEKFLMGNLIWFLEEFIISAKCNNSCGKLFGSTNRLNRIHHTFGKIINRTPAEAEMDFKQRTHVYIRCKILNCTVHFFNSTRLLGRHHRVTF